MQKHPLHIHNAIYDPIADLSTWRAMPTRSVDHLDPFLFLNHHGPQQYGPNNRGLPFGPHPHRGFETLTFVLQGDITHKDSVTGESVITAGGIQWMTAGSGLIHAEVSSEEFKRKGGMEEVIQLWMNLPAKYKMTAPKYTGLQKESIPAISFDDGKGALHLASGTFQGQQGPVDSMTGLFTSTLDIKTGGAFYDVLPESSQVLLYVVNGQVEVNGAMALEHQLVQLSLDGTELSITASQDSQLVYCYGSPFDEPIAAHGPFVMNTAEEIRQAIIDYQSGKLGRLDL
ncbi:MAG: pirin family protein [Phaeodactylibacter sp.]|nr:pirin family protein [Phaeodactylibacter sp.]MCB9274682.1 pirin family protein [Lewinellaceae bacterium]